VNKNLGGAHGMLPLVAMKEQEENDVRDGKVWLLIAAVGHAGHVAEAAHTR